ncbi:MAG: acyl-CoA thioesterase [Parasporobacterium sp.]|nr:acyl-CoA thioesterase [Parasporobacterium sp.]
MKPYTHKVQYYETDMMGITHHANYIRWMEETRIDFMDQLGFSYSRMESDGILSPVRSVSCTYRRPSTFGDMISITVSVESFNGVLLTLKYEMRNQDDETICEARSEHVFVNREGRIVRLKKEQPEFCQAIEAEINNTKQEVR